MNKENSFIIVKEKKGSGLFKVTMCAETLKPLSSEQLSGIPVEWSAQDFYDYYEEGKRFAINIEFN